MKANKNVLIIVVLLILGAIWFLGPSGKNKSNSTDKSTIENVNKSVQEDVNKDVNKTADSDISELTKEEVVVAFVKRNHKLPDYYITKSEARKHGWDPSLGNLCDVLPGKAIGGDHFGNREHRLPESSRYYEADINYDCGHRDADRMIFTKDGEVWVTYNHYKTFEKK